MNHMGSIYAVSQMSEKTGFSIQGLRSTATALHSEFYPSTLLSAKRRLSILLLFWVSHMIWPLESVFLDLEFTLDIVPTQQQLDHNCNMNSLSPSYDP